MFITNQNNIWDMHWKNQSQVTPEHILNHPFAKEAYRCLRQFIDEKKDRLVLEAGCGTGRLCCMLARDFPEMHVTGIDVSPHSLKIAGKVKEYLSASNAYLEDSDIFRIPYPDNYFDVVFNEGVIEHFSICSSPNYMDAVKEMTRVTKKGGKVIIAVPNWYNFPHTFYKAILKMLGREFVYGYEKSFTHAELEALYRGSGLHAIELSAFYPAHGFYRLAVPPYHVFFYLLGKCVDMFRIVDSFTKQFGIEIMIKGIK